MVSKLAFWYLYLPDYKILFSNRNLYENVRNFKFLAFRINFTSGSISACLYLCHGLHILSVWRFRHKMRNAFTYPLHKMAGPRHVAQLADPSIGLALQVS